MADAAAEQNPLTAGLGKTAIPDPCTLVIFGATGDLTRRKLLPALYNLALDGLLPASFAVVGFARRDWTDETLREVARDGSEKFSRRKPDPAHWADFESAVFYVNGSFEDREAYPLLQKRLEEVEAARGIPGNRIFYLSIPPSAIGTCVANLRAAGLVRRQEAGRLMILYLRLAISPSRSHLPRRP